MRGGLLPLLTLGVEAALEHTPPLAYIDIFIRT